jgi:hypothetical protein
MHIHIRQMLDILEDRRTLKVNIALFCAAVFSLCMQLFVVPSAQDVPKAYREGYVVGYTKGFEHATACVRVMIERAEAFDRDDFVFECTNLREKNFDSTPR